MDLLPRVPVLLLEVVVLSLESRDFFLNGLLLIVELQILGLELTVANLQLDELLSLVLGGLEQDNEVLLQLLEISAQVQVVVQELLGMLLLELGLFFDVLGALLKAINLHLVVDLHDSFLVSVVSLDIVFRLVLAGVSVLKIGKFLSKASDVGHILENGSHYHVSSLLEVINVVSVYGDLSAQLVVVLEQVVSDGSHLAKEARIGVALLLPLEAGSGFLELLNELVVDFLAVIALLLS